MSGSTSTAFDLLARPIQRWVWRRQWRELHAVQEQAIVSILDGRDVLISSPTASGKTEAAFLPICSALLDEAATSLGVIYISPLKALINDQNRRLEELFECINAPVTPWHGDIAAHIKRRFINRPKGVLLITPESLEAMFVNRGTSIPRLVNKLRFIVVDELHAFIGTERGRQLQSLMHRLELAAQRKVSRIGLSATLGDPDLATEFLRPRFSESVELVISSEMSREILMLVRGYRRIRSNDATVSESTIETAKGSSREVVKPLSGDDIEISRHLFERLRGKTNLVFANRRTQVELFADLLRRQGERANVPNEFWPHHGNLSRTIREEAERRLRSQRPSTVVATTTLELGIDIGAVDSIAQIGAPRSVASMTQRLGRSGRKPGDPSTIRIYIQEHEITENTPPVHQLRVSLVQTIAMIRLLLRRWVEPPPPSSLHLSTLVQQVLSLTAQHGGFRAIDAYRALCSTGPFHAVSQSTLAKLLRDLASHELITQTHDGLIVLDLSGERLVNNFDFYAAFSSFDEWRLVNRSRVLGTLPVTFPLLLNAFLIFAGRRWRIVGIDEKRREVRLESAAGGKVPQFYGSGALIHDCVRKEMRQVYMDGDVPNFLDASGGGLLHEGRIAFQRFNLRDQPFVQRDTDTYVFPWVGDRTLNTLALQFRAQGANVIVDQPALRFISASPEDVKKRIDRIADSEKVDPKTLAAVVGNKKIEKHHKYLSEQLLNSDYASSQLDAEGSFQTAKSLARLMAKRM